MERRLLTAFALAFFFVLLLRTAWLSDTAYYTLRTAENASRGLGFTWNPAERVQVFDHPLWTFALTAGHRVTGEAYGSALTLSIVCSLLAAALVFASAATECGVVIAAIALALSPSFLTFSTSGLEGPLVHLLIAAFALVALDDRPGRSSSRRLATLAGLAALTHFLTLIMTLPLLAARLRAQQRRDRWVLIALWLAPCAAWIVFATWYYGTPLPNPLVSRLSARGVIGRELQHGVAWLADVVDRDPLTVAIILAGITLGMLSRAQSRERELAVGSLLFLVGVVLTGGDPMSGRWLGAPLVVAVIQIGRDRRLERPMAGGLAIAAAVALAFVTPQTVLRSDATFGEPPPVDRAPVDARALDYQATGLLTNVRQSRPPMWPGAYDALQAWRDPARVFVARDRPGFTGFAAGYGVYVVDTTGRGDPLLGRLTPGGVPSSKAGSWTVVRDVPEGYLASLPSHDIQLADPTIADECARIRLLTRGSLFDWRRLIAAWQLLVPPARKAPAQRSEPTS